MRPAGPQGGRPQQGGNPYHARMPQWPNAPVPTGNQQRPTGAPPQPQPAAQQAAAQAPNGRAAAPVTANTRLPLTMFPPAIAAALKQSWDQTGFGYVTVGELCAGANGQDSARGARQARELTRLGQNKVASPSPFKQPGVWNEMPGDLATLDNVGLAEGQGVWERMAAIIRIRRLDVRILLDAHDRRNAGLVDLECFRRALCYAFGNNWTELAMTSAEFDEISKPYLTRDPKKPGEPPGFVFWQKFATDLQTLADRKMHSDAFMARLAKIEARERVEARIQKEYGITAYELQSTFDALKHRLTTHGGGGSSGALTQAFRRMDADKSGTVRVEEIKHFLVTTQRGMEQVSWKVLDAIVDLCDADGAGDIDYSELSKLILCDDIVELLTLVPDRSLTNKKQDAKNAKVGDRGCTVAELQAAQQTIKETLMNKYGRVSAALRAIDRPSEGGGGILSRSEILEMLHAQKLIKHIDYHTGAVHGTISMAVADTLIDFADDNKDGQINYQEFTKVLTADDIMHVAAPKASGGYNRMLGQGRS